MKTTIFNTVTCTLALLLAVPFATTHVQSANKRYRAGSATDRKGSVYIWQPDGGQLPHCLRLLHGYRRP